MLKYTSIAPELVSSLARSYHPLKSLTQLNALLQHTADLMGVEVPMNYSPHKAISEIIIRHYKGESALKAMLVNRFLKCQVTAAFEIKANKSRADFLTINGDSSSFEIKSELDNLSKLAKQVADYEKVFDYNYIVIDGSHFKKAADLIPPRYGILIAENGTLREKRKGKRNNKHDSSTQLLLLTKKEFQEAFPIPGITREEIAINFTDAEINARFKVILKKRYARKWNFLVLNSESINPVDYQFFFRHNLPPSIIYEK